MTFEDDMCRFQFDGGLKTITCKSIGINWPPPEKLEFLTFEFERVSFSVITDEQREKMTHVIRGALYRPIRG